MSCFMHTLQYQNILIFNLSFKQKLPILFCLLLIPFNLIPMDEGLQDTSQKLHIPLYLPNFYPLSDYDINREYIEAHQSLLQQYELHFNEGEESLQDMLDIFKSAPLKAQAIVPHLEDPDYFDDSEYRYAMFFGPPGSGKTTIARAIAYQLAKNADWYPLFIASGHFGGNGDGKRNKTAERFNNLFDAIAISNRKTLLIIDELDELLKHYNNEHHDTGMTSKALWSWLDKQVYESNNKIFFIGIMNYLHMLPQPFKDRILLCSVEFKPLTDIMRICALFRSKLERKKIILDPTINNEYIKEQFSKLKNKPNERNIHDIARLLRRLYIMYHGRTIAIAIDKDLLSEAITEYANIYKCSDYNHIDETEAQRQERHHLNTLEQNELHFIQQHHIHNTLHTQASRTYSGNVGFNVYGVNIGLGASHTPGKNVSETNKYVTEEQRRLLEKKVPKTKQSMSSQEAGLLNSMIGRGLGKGPISSLFTADE